MHDKVILTLARAQHGLVTRRQLGSLGVSASRIARSRRSGWFIPVLPGVMLVAPAPDTFKMRCRAIVLWMAGVGFVSGQSAGRLHGLFNMRKYPIHYTVPQRHTMATPNWIELHRTGWYDADHDRTELDGGLIVATPERMLFGLAADFKQRRFDGAADDAWNLKLSTPERMDVYLHLHRCRGKDGVSTIERWLERSLEQENPAHSYLERDLIDALRDVGLPEPVRQFQLLLLDCLGHHEPIRLDIAWPDVRLAIEPGHSRFHQGATAVERDTLRDLACSEMGWNIHRLTENIRSDLHGFARRIHNIHRQRQRDIPLDRRGSIPNT